MSQPTSASVLPPTPLPAASRSGAVSRLLSFPTVLAAALSYLVFVLARRDLADPDLWWHLRNAQRWLTTGHLASVDSYSYTAPGTVVLPFEWLSEIPYYLAYKWAGLSAVFLLVFLLSTAIVLGIFRLAYLASHDVKNSFLLTVGAAILSAVSIGARTLLFGWLYLVILLLILESVRGGSWKRLWLVPPLFCLWVNTHGSWPMGMVIFGIFIASGLLEGSWGHVYATRWSGPQLQKLLLAAVASAAAVFVNPLGYRLVAYPFEAMFGAQSSVNNIQEFASVDFHTPWGKVAILLIFATLLVALFSREPWRLDELGFILLALYFSLTNIRFMYLAAILAPPVFARRVKLMTPYDRSSDRRLYNAAALAVVLALFIFSVPRPSKLQSPVNYPAAAVAYMKTNGIQGRVFHDYVWGGYLIWYAPELKVFIDGRWDPYALNGVFNDYWSAASIENPQAVLDKYKVEYVLMPTASPLSKFLKSTPTWTVLYKDETSILLHRSPTP